MYTNLAIFIYVSLVDSKHLTFSTCCCIASHFTFSVYHIYVEISVTHAVPVVNQNAGDATDFGYVRYVSADCAGEECICRQLLF